MLVTNMATKRHALEKSDGSCSQNPATGTYTKFDSVHAETTHFFKVCEGGLCNDELPHLLPNFKFAFVLMF
jgi:hypothetical protein